MPYKHFVFLLLFILTSLSSIYTQETSIQFPHLDFHMKMNQQLKPSISYNAEANIVVGDKSGLVLSIGVQGDDLNVQSSLNDLIKLDTLKLTISPASFLNFHTFYGRYKYLGEDPVIPRGMQFNFTPGADAYGYKKIDGAGIGFNFPILEGRYEPEVIVYSDSVGGIDYLNVDALVSFRFEKWFLELYTGIAVPTIGSIDPSFKGRFGLSVYSILNYANVYFATYIPAHFGKEFTFDDIYLKFSQYLLINNFEQTFSIVSLGAESGNITDPIVGYNGIPDMNIYLSLGGRINNIGFGVDYGFIYGVYASSIENPISNRVGGYIDLIFLGLTYKLGMFYTLPGSGAYIKDVAGAGEVGFYVSVFGRS